MLLVLFFLKRSITIGDRIHVVFSTLVLQPHVWWLDNYAKFYHIRVPSEENAYLKQCRWTVCGARPLPGDCLPREFDDGGNLVSAMPDDLYGDAPSLLKFLRKFARRPMSYVKSLTSLHRLYTFPPGPPTGPRRTPSLDEFWSNRGEVGGNTFVHTALEADYWLQSWPPDRSPTLVASPPTHKLTTGVLSLMSIYSIA